MYHYHIQHDLRLSYSNRLSMVDVGRPTIASTSNFLDATKKAVACGMFPISCKRHKNVNVHASIYV
jgi:hypothetical protein